MIGKNFFNIYIILQTSFGRKIDMHSLFEPLAWIMDLSRDDIKEYKFLFEIQQERGFNQIIKVKML